MWRRREGYNGVLYVYACQEPDCYPLDLVLARLRPVNEGLYRLLISVMSDFGFSAAQGVRVRKDIGF